MIFHLFEKFVIEIVYRKSVASKLNLSEDLVLGWSAVSKLQGLGFKIVEFAGNNI